MNTVDIEITGQDEMKMLDDFIKTGPVQQPVMLTYKGETTVRVRWQDPITLLQIGMGLATYRCIQAEENKVKQINTYLEEHIRPLKEKSSREAELVEATLTNVQRFIRNLPE